MVFITEDLVRKKSEHNELEICTLEELSLHQENIEKIEHLQNWCKHLQILLLQGNIISKIENLHKLKKLQYLNLALNNIEVIENLEKCESLEKLDLTLNFVGDLTSVCTLQNNIHLKELTLTGNPCADFAGYKNYVIAKLPQLQRLDNEEISRSERIKAQQIIDTVEKEILIDQEKYLKHRELQKTQLSKLNRDAIDDEDFWQQETENSPEIRVEMARRQQKTREMKRGKKEEKEQREIRLFTKDGRPLNINQAKLKFHLQHEDMNEIILTLEIYKYLDTNLINVDLQPTFVKVTIKNKIFQIVLPEEICTSTSVAQRSQTTGYLVITMPKIKIKEIKTKKNVDENVRKEPTAFEIKQRREYLEIGPDRLSQICNIAECCNNKKDDFVDDDSVPPLE